MVKNNAWNFDTTFATGDILYANTTSTLTKLGIGSTGQVLRVSSGLPSWQNVSPFSINNQSPYYIEDFMSNQNSWNLSTTGSGATFTAEFDSAHPGLYQLTTGTTSTGFVSYDRGITGDGNSYLFGGGTYTLQAICKIPTLSTGTQRFKIRIGYFDSSTSTLANGAWFEYIDNVNSGNWTIKTSSSSTVTTANTTTAPDTNWHKYGIAVNAGATSISFLIDDVELTNSPITTNIPISTGREVGLGFQIIKSVGSTASTFQIDYVFHQIVLTSARA